MHCIVLTMTNPLSTAQAPATSHPYWQALLTNLPYGIHGLMAMPMVCLQGAYLADTFWGRYKTILVFSCIYLLVRDLI